MKKVILLLCLFASSFSFGQYEQYINLVMPYLSDSIRSGFFYFKTPNNFQPGQLYQLYRTGAPDPDNDMLLLETKTDSLVGLVHYKYQQTYKGIPVEGAGCIEHYQNNMLLFINAKIADSINKNPIPEIDSITAVKKLIDNLKKRDKKIKFAWESGDWEHQLQKDLKDSTATYYPTAKLIWAIDTLKDVVLINPGSRYSLAYKISVTTISPTYETFIYFVDANTGSVLKFHSTSFDNGPANIYGYGSKSIDTQFKGWLTQKWILKTNDAFRNIHTKSNPNGSTAWGLLSEIKDDDDNWGNSYSTETATHYHVSNAWDYFREHFNRNGQNNSGIAIRVRAMWSAAQAQFSPGNNNYNNLTFGGSNGWNYGLEPSIVAHEFMHGVTYHTASLAGSYESGALNESFSDIFGVVIQATMLDGGSTDWIVGNFIPYAPTRSLKDPNTTGQPDTYLGSNWYTGTDYSTFVHTNLGVQNKWFFVLAHGDNGTNDNGDYYNVSGIGMSKAANITYFALAAILMNSSQYTDSREATIAAAKLLYGTCSVEHQATQDAWYAVGLGDKNDCTYTLSIDELATNSDVSIYPNPSSEQITIELPSITNQAIKIMDMSGKIVSKFYSNQIYFKQDISSLRAGIYFIHFSINGSNVVKKLIVQ